uniref:Uncharacterized protein n=1 Tax=Globisporangium ultimum (strain ATCC 200006 / CBS 805.95 / DAOM BR144) TaxID=431595 RepID=K3X7M1_GLOUD
MWPQRFRASITTAAAALASVSAATGSCPEVPAHTLSSACNGACEVEQACMAPATTSTSCRCFGVGKDQLLVLIPFDKATIAALRASPPATYETIAGKDDTALYSWASNDDLTTVAALNLSSVVSSVVLRGGSSMDGLNKSFVANVDIDDKFLSGQTQLTWITVENLDLKDSMSKLAANLPSSLLSIGLQNNLLTEFPTPLTTLTALQTLNLGYNNIADINSNHEMSELTSLSLQANKISSFTAYFPKLSHLDLSYNQLTAVPEVIAKHSLLTSLYLNGNNIPAFTQSHAIANLKTLTLFMNNMTQFDAILPNLEYLPMDASLAESTGRSS